MSLIFRLSLASLLASFFSIPAFAAELPGDLGPVVSDCDCPPDHGCPPDHCNDGCSVDPTPTPSSPSDDGCCDDGDGCDDGCDEGGCCPDHA